MASISISTATTGSIELYLTNLDRDWEGGTRTVTWYLGKANGSQPTISFYHKKQSGEDIENKAPSGGKVKFSGLITAAKYYVLCEVYCAGKKLGSFTGQAETDQWVELKRGSLFPIDGPTNTGSIDLYDEEVYRYSVTFKHSGTARFYTTGATDTHGYLGTQTGIFNASVGGPASFLKEDDDNDEGLGPVKDNNFYIEWNVISGTTYYVWVRVHSYDDEGETVLCIDPPGDTSWHVTYESIAEPLKDDISRTIILQARDVRCLSVQFANSGEASFYTTGSFDTKGHLSVGNIEKPDTLEDAKPPAYDDMDDDSGKSLNFKITRRVKKDTYYHIWVHRIDNSSEAAVPLHIDVPKTSIAKWNWSASNGSASAEQTSAAYSAVINKTAVKNFSYLVWNDLCDKVKEVLDATDNIWDNTYATYANTKMSSSDKLTATKFNSLRCNIDWRNNTGVKEAVAKEDVLGSYFTTIASSINDWIDTL